MTTKDTDVLRTWLNREDSVAWIIKAGRSGQGHRWRATDSLDALSAGEYYLWHKASGPLNIPSGSIDVPAEVVRDPYSGWSQHLAETDALCPWFGANLPGPFFFKFTPHGREAPGSIGRSGFNWPGDYYRPIGNPALPAAKRWWTRLGRFVRMQSTGIPWPSPGRAGRSLAYAFPDAYAEMLRSRPYDVNP